MSTRICYIYISSPEALSLLSLFRDSYLTAIREVPGQYCVTLLLQTYLAKVVFSESFRGKSFDCFTGNRRCLEDLVVGSLPSKVYSTSKTTVSITARREWLVDGAHNLLSHEIWATIHSLSEIKPSKLCRQSGIGYASGARIAMIILRPIGPHPI